MRTTTSPRLVLHGHPVSPHVRSLTLRAWGFARLARLRRTFYIGFTYMLK